MEALNPLYHVALYVKNELEAGKSTHQALSRYIAVHENDMGQRIGSWFMHPERSHFDVIRRVFASPEGRSLLTILAQGLDGRPIHAQLTDLTKEIEQQSELALDSFIRAQPLRALIPLICFMFPAFLLIILGPILARLLASPM